MIESREACSNSMSWASDHVSKESERISILEIELKEEKEAHASTQSRLDVAYNELEAAKSLSYNTPEKYTHLE